MSEKNKRFMWMRSPQQALDVIAEIIHSQAPLKEQDAWLEAVIELGYAEVEGYGDDVE